MAKLHSPQEKLFLSLLYGMEDGDGLQCPPKKKCCQGCVCVACGILFVFIYVCVSVCMNSALSLWIVHYCRLR